MPMISLNDRNLKDIAILRDIATNNKNTHYARRATILLFLEEGKSTMETAAATSVTVATVRKWKRAYFRDGLNIFPKLQLGQQNGTAKHDSSNAKTSSLKTAEKQLSKRQTRLVNVTSKARKLLKKISKNGVSNKLQSSKKFKRSFARLKAEVKKAESRISHFESGKKTKGLKTQVKSIRQELAQLTGKMK